MLQHIVYHDLNIITMKYIIYVIHESKDIVLITRDDYNKISDFIVEVSAIQGRYVEYDKALDHFNTIAASYSTYNAFNRVKI